MGSHLTAELLREGCSVRLIVRNAGKTDLLKATLRRMAWPTVTTGSSSGRPR